MKKVILKIDGMTCSACSNGLEKYLNKQDGVKNATVNLVMENANIEYDDKKLNLEDLNKFVAKAGFKSLGIDNFEKEEKKKSRSLYKLISIAFFAILNLYISMSHMVGLPVIPYLHMIDYPINYSVCLLILTTIVIALCYDIIKNGFKNLIHKTPNMDTLVTIGVLSSYIYSIYGTIMILRGNHDFVESLYYESASTVLFFVKIGKYIESRNKDKTKSAIQKLMTITPKNAVIERDGKEVTVTIDEINVGDIVVCKPGEKIAVDGVVVDGLTHINESFITGESVPVKKEKDSNVIAGSINYEGVIRYKAEKIGRNSTVSEIVRMVVEANSTKAPIGKIADKISSIFVPVVMCLAVICFAVWMAISKDFETALNVFISILVIACPCSLGLATPLAIIIGSGIASNKGILIKTSEALENAHKIKTAVFDKTGTLTKGELTISKIYNYSNLSDKDIIKITASIEKNSEHPIAKAIVNKAYEESIITEEVQNFKSITGGGVSAEINDESYIIGNQKLIEESGITFDIEDKNINILKDTEDLSKSGNSILFIAKNNQIIALIGVADVIKENVKDVVKKLKDQNIEVVMLTGDNENTANIIAEQIGITKVIANVKPKEKAEQIENLKQNGKVLMCGDGINDSVSLVKSDIGASISNGTDVAIDSANVVFMNDDIDKINDLIYISKRTIRNIKQNLFWAFIYNVAMIPIAMGIFKPLGISLNPMIAAGAMTLSSLTVVLNALRLRRMSRK